MEDNHKHVSTSEVLASYYNIVDSDPPPCQVKRQGYVKTFILCGALISFGLHFIIILLQLTVELYMVRIYLITLKHSINLHNILMDFISFFTY